MAIDIDSLPPRIETYPPRPSLLVWSLVFIACLVAGSAVALMQWPKHAPTVTPVFWVAVVIVPLTIAATITLVPFLLHAGKERSITAWNSRRDQYVAHAFDTESRPVALLGSVCCFSMDEGSQVSKVAAGEVMLAPQQTPDRTATVAARWFRAPAFSVGDEPGEYDADRQRAVLYKILPAMLGALKSVISALPVELALKVSLFVDAPSFEEDIHIRFQSCWDDLALRAFTFDTGSTGPGLMSLDGWLDSVADGNREHVTLLVIVQLHNLVVQTPPPGSTEAAVALLMIHPDTVARYRLAARAHLHRPRQGTIASLPEVVPLALKWGNVQPADIQHLWHAGFDKVGEQALLSAIRAEKINLAEGQQISGEHNVDRLVGDAGIAADWFALACAIDFAQSFGGPQLVARHNGVNSMLMITRPVLHSPIRTQL